MPRLLVIEDDPVIGQAVAQSLEGLGHEVIWAPDGAAALDATDHAGADLVLLDLGLPDVDGVELCRSLRAADPAATIVILTARTEEIDVVVGLEAGADDYLSKPFRLGELLARVRAHLRRNQARPVGRLVVGDLTIDTGARRVWVGDQEVELRAKEFDLLARLAREAGQAVTRERLMSDVWDEHWFGSTKTLDMHISALRRKLGETAGQASRITTLRGVGYRLETS